MSKDTQEDNDNVLFKKLRKLINLIDQLRDCGVNEYIKLPRICSLGTQSSGKSSVLESIVGLDFLPRGDGVVTRRPLELRLCHINSGQPWAIFEERKGKKFTDFIEVKPNRILPSSTLKEALLLFISGGKILISNLLHSPTYSLILSLLSATLVRSAAKYSRG